MSQVHSQISNVSLEYVGVTGISDSKINCYITSKEPHMWLDILRKIIDVQ